MTEETIIKNQIKDYLNFKGTFNYPLLQGIASYKGLPDRIMHHNGQVIYLEIKTKKGKLSEHQIKFQEQCEKDGIRYLVIRDLDDIINYFKNNDKK